MIAKRPPLEPITNPQIAEAAMLAELAACMSNKGVTAYHRYVEQIMRDDHPGAHVMSYAEWLNAGKPGI